MKPTVSVCVPLYNTGKYIGKTIDSIIKQTYTDFEFLIIDNASTDNSYQIASKFTDKRIKLIRNEKTISGVKNWNKCIKLAKGDLIALYHSDDLYEPTIVEEEVNEFLKYPQLGAVFTAGYSIDENDDVTEEMYLDERLRTDELIDFNLAFSTYIEKGFGSFICPSVMIPKRIYNEIGLYDEKELDFAFDYDLYFRVLEKYPVKILEKKLIKYRVHKEQGSNVFMKCPTHPNESYKLFSKFLASPALTLKIDDTILRSIGFREKKNLYKCAVNALRINDKKLSNELLRKAGNISPDFFDKIIKLVAQTGNSALLKFLMIKLRGVK